MGANIYICIGFIKQCSFFKKLAVLKVAISINPTYVNLAKQFSLVVTFSDNTKIIPTSTFIDKARIIFASSIIYIETFQ